MRGMGLIVAGCLLTLSGSVLSTAQAAEFYAGKTIEVVVPFKEGGGTDVWMRVMVPYLQKHIAGNPKILIRNIPGGESIHGVNQYVLRSKADGLNMVATSATNYFHALLGVKVAYYILIVAIGFHVATLVFLVGFLRFLPRAGWGRTALYTASMFAVIEAFTRLLGMELPEGFWQLWP